MSDSRDLIDKTDALLGRYRNNPKASPESDFPVLTDIYDKRQLPLSAPEDFPGGMTGQGGNAEKRRIDTPEPSQDALVDEVLRLLAPIVDEALGDPLTERLNEHLRRALSALTGQVRIDIETLVRNAVRQAVDRALAEKEDGIPSLAPGIHRNHSNSTK